MNGKDVLARVRAALASRAYRITKQRLAIARELAELGRYVTARDLHQRLARTRSGVGLATTYRTLDALVEVGAASARPQSNGEVAYLFCRPEHHHHAVCTKCGQVADVPCRSVGRFARALDADLHFTLTQHRLEFFGVCSRCS